MNNATTPAVSVSDYGAVVYLEAHGADLDAVRAVVVRAAHDFVFADGRTASVEVASAGKFGGAVVTGYVATVRFGS